MRYWTEKMGIGPFYYMDVIPIIECHYKGEPTPLAVSLGVAYSGPIQIELIQPTSDAPSVYRDFLDSGKEGLHHLGFLTKDYDADLERLLKAGLKVEQSGAALNAETKWAYFESTGHPGTVMELIALSDALAQLFDMAREASIDWDGSDPMRSLG
jgi:hypothetical protein